MTYYYFILLSSIIIPIVFSFHSKVQFDKKFHILIKSIPISALPFIIWDVLFTKKGIWGFNSEFVLGLYIYNLPIEEILFFLCIPFCCLYTYHLVEIYDIVFFKIYNFHFFNLFLAIILTIVGTVHYQNQYTFYCFISCAMMVLFEIYCFKKINYQYFYTTMLLIIPPFIIVNGALTGLFFNQTVVWYSTVEILEVRLLTIPIEDLIYAYQLILFNLIIYQIFINRKTYCN